MAETVDVEFGADVPSYNAQVDKGKQNTKLE